MKKKHFGPFLCRDCGTPIARRGARCLSCHHVAMRHPQKHCADCGVPIERRATRCPTCAPVLRRRPIRLCAACGQKTVGRRSTWCWSCSYVMRDKRKGQPPAACTRCGGTMTRRGPDGLCMRCRHDIKRPQRYCPDCGIPVQRHVARCRPCTARSKIVRSAADVTYGPEWQGQKQRALRRDKATCRRCGATRESGTRVHVHHIVPWRVSHDSSPGNLGVLCVSCHGTIHVIYRRQSRPSVEQFRLWFAQFIGISQLAR